MLDQGVVLLTPFFTPNIGGVETHLDDQVNEMNRLGYKIYVQTYSPLTTDNTTWKPYEEKAKNVKIWRYRWIGKNLFHILEKYFLLDFLYLTPYLLIRSSLWMIFNHKKIDVIHSHGFNTAVIGILLKKIFHKRLIVSIHAVYGIKKNLFFTKFIVSVLNKTDNIICLSKASYKELISLGVDRRKLAIFKYWVNLKGFYPLRNKTKLRNELSIENRFTVLFVGRLLEKKGVKILAEVARLLPEINFLFIGVGPKEEFLRQKTKKLTNVKFLGGVQNDHLNKYYNSADVFCIPSQYEEGYGRVVMEAVACGIPVVGSNKGGIPEALDKSVSILVEPTVGNLKREIYRLYTDKNLYVTLSANCRKYAQDNFSEKNISLITRYY